MCAPAGPAAIIIINTRSRVSPPTIRKGHVAETCQVFYSVRCYQGIEGIFIPGVLELKEFGSQKMVSLPS